MRPKNIAVGLAAGSRGDAEIALGTAFGGAIFLVCFALGLGALIAPLRASLPRTCSVEIEGLGRLTNPIVAASSS
ncbi:MAG: hypothetical protein JF886_02855 [Candidatus Dormibacteraeota bacterium]|uniref:Sodium/calcium exchanger membrane region domain-containing protein n=1 Tax=Candidatus Aeolococcus gillhamiae TaxID=3127015 RepID=A0A934N4F2_9BACT|nr:hypothetical protein [Candidatus Dormibacteraeota bacterium]